MNFKIDENLPAECATLLRGAGFGADTVAEENLAGADDTVIARSVRASGIIVLRLKRQDKHAVLGLVLRIIPALKTRLPAGDLWIVEPDRIRFRAQ